MRYRWALSDFAMTLPCQIITLGGGDVKYVKRNKREVK